MHAPASRPPEAIRLFGSAPPQRSDSDGARGRLRRSRRRLGEEYLFAEIMCRGYEIRWGATIDNIDEFAWRDDFCFFQNAG